MSVIVTTGGATEGTGKNIIVGIGASDEDATINGGNETDVIIADHGPTMRYHGNEISTIATAANLDAASNWAVGSNPLVADDSIPYTTVLGQGPALQYYAVTVGAGQTLTVDMDFASEQYNPVAWNSEIDLVDAAGNVLASNDDSNRSDGGLGSEGDGATTQDSYLTFTNTGGAAATYYVEVGKHGADGPVPLDSRDSYLLNFSVSGHAHTAQVVTRNYTIDGGAGNDYVVGGAGDDTIHGGSSGNDILYGEGGNDTLINESGGELHGGGGNDLLYGLSGIFDGGDGTDTASFAGADFSLTIDLAQGEVFYQGAYSSSLISIENAVGTIADDTITGSDADNILTGGKGNDNLTGGLGNDTLDGGDGIDRAIYSDATHGVSVDLNVTGAQDTGWGMDTLIGIEALLGSAYDDRLVGSATLANDLRGSAGDDVIVAGGKADAINGGSGFDIVDYSGAAHNLTIDLSLTTAQDTGQGNDSFAAVEEVIGSRYGDTLTGSGAANTLIGGAGNDTLDGGLSPDILTGGAGSDKFMFTTTVNGTNIDTITDFQIGQDKVILDHAVFAGLAAGALAAGAFYKGAAAHDADDRIIYNAATGALLFDKDGTGAAKAVQFATLSTGLNLTASGFQIV